MDELNLKDSLDQLMIQLSHQYKHIIGDQTNIAFSEKIIESIVNYYEDILNFMPGNVYWFDNKGTAVGCNKNVLDMLGLQSLAEFKGLSFADIGRIGNWPEAATESFYQDTLEVIRTGKPKLNIEEPPIPHLDGRIIYFLSSRVPLFDHVGNAIGIVGISIDITELKAIQSALETSKKQAEAASLSKSEFVINMSHDIKTPLAGIIGTAELLTYRLKDEDLKLAHNLLLSGQQLLDFFNNCLQVFKLENSDVTIFGERFSLKNLLYEIRDLFLPSVKIKNLLFNIDFAKEVPEYLLGNRLNLYRILLNIVGNAVKFTHSGYVKVITKLKEKISDSRIVISFIIEDSGIGIPKTKQEIIFDRFTRLIPSYKGTYNGSGIGLSIVQKFVQAMQGEIFVESEEEKGSRFTINMPFDISLNQSDLAFTQYIETLKDAKLSEGAKTSKKPHILLVEDNPTAQLIQNVLLTSLHCRVDPVDCGEKALAMFNPGKYDLIFLDIGLPGMQGDVLARLIREKEKNSSFHVPIIALTAHTSEDTNKYYLSIGMEAILHKPLSREQAEKIIIDYFN